MKNIFINYVIMVFITTFSFASGSEDTSNKKVLRVGHDSQENSALHQAFLFFQEKVESNSNLNIKIEIYPAAQLGNAKELFDTVQQGNLETTAAATVLLSSSIPEFNVLDVFYLFDSTEHAHKSLDGPAGQRLLQVLEPLGLHGFGYMEVGMRNMSNSRNPIASLEDLKGLKIRAASNPLQIAAWKSAGAAPIPMAFGEIFTSLQQGLLDGQESAISSMYTQRFFEAQKYISITEHIYTNYLWVINKTFWDSLNQKEQDTLDTIAKETIKKQRKIAAEFSNTYLEKLKSEGNMKVNTVDTNFKSQLSKKLNAPTKQEIKKLTGSELYNFVIKEIDKVR